MSKTSILIPFQSSDPNRKKAFKWLLTYYKKMLPEAEICIGTLHQSTPCKAKAVNQAAKKASGDIFVIIDADILCSPTHIQQSIQLLKHYPWVIPYKKVLDINKQSTSSLLETKPTWPLSLSVKTSPRFSSSILPAGGINILSKKCFYKVGGFDERFIGWGGEDDAFACAMDTLCGKHKRLNNSIYHLWHPTQRATGNSHYNENVLLARKYCKASGDIQEMKKIIKHSTNSY
ncbi:galactosyltransferase-related protein [Pontibacillus yanchengensis]|uniref:Galactosyltransferase C-terminal domain-containing protein n=1 Tax=Pontibacillus yanchengensis Y32 TaxID=1385514 RepID=A0A0A2T9B5_9BACI|nr:galactosyltransferase-related protein [Pontibacillus yanchengensis]KGP72372.1 hypothetical protein N782_11960 [Pontibacillus yanchengensis Y32]